MKGVSVGEEDVENAFPLDFELSLCRYAVVCNITIQSQCHS